ncbi:MAG: response regulator [Raineya sp.]|nr:response regulator [Raineya sp.]
MDLEHISKVELIAEIERLRKMVSEDLIQELQESNAALQDLFDNSNDLIFVCNTEGKILFANRIFTQKLGYTLNELPSLNFRELISPQHRFSYLRQLSLLLAGEEVPKFQMVLLNKQKQKIYLKGKVSIRFEEGKPVALRGIMYDTTDKVRIEAELMSQTARLKAIFESGSHIMWSVNRKREFTAFNQNYVKALQIQYGITPKIGENLDNLRAALEKDGLRAFWKEKMKKAFAGEMQHFEVKARDINGNTVWQEVYLNPILLPDNTIEEVAAIAHDITENKKIRESLQKAKEFAEQSLKVKESFLANMSHEIRTPMNGIIGMIELLSLTPLNEIQKEYVETLKKASQTLLHILNDILDLSKIEAGKMRLFPKSTHFRQTMQKVYDLFLPQAKQKQNTLTLQISSQIAECLEIDETRFIQILSNLVANAIKFTEKGDIVILAEVLENQNNRQKIKISVIDTGIGVSEKDRDKLFQYFSQVDSSMAKAQGGTGLGLAISKQLAQMMNGEMNYLPNPKGKGSIFYFTFEAQISNKIFQENAPNIIWQTLEKPLKVLLVDDNAINRKVATEMLKSLGAVVHSAENALQAFELLTKENFEVVFLDIQMPEIDGITALHQIRKMNLSYRPRVIALTAYAMQEDEQKLLAEGFDDYLAKPVRPETLYQKLTQQNPIIPTESSSTAAWIDEKTWNSLVALTSKEMVLESLQECISETQIQISEIQELLTKENFAEIPKILHTIKGATATLGLSRFAEKTAWTEKQLKEQPHTNWKTILQEWEREWEGFLKFYQDTKKLEK